MDQSSYSASSNIPRINKRKLITGTLGTNPNISHGTNHFLDDDYPGKSKFDFTYQHIKDWTMDCYQRARPGLKFRRNLGFTKYSKIFAFLTSFLVLIFIFYALRSTKSTDVDGKLNLLNINQHKLEDDVDSLKNRINELGDLKIEPPSRLESLIRSSNLKDHLELFAKAKIDEIMVKAVDQRMKPLIEREIGSMIDRMVKYDLMSKINEQIVKNIDLVLEDKLEHTTRHDLDGSALNNTIKDQIKKLIYEKNSLEDDRKPDYAAEFNNAKVISASFTYTEPDAIKIFSIPLWSLSSSPSHLLKRNPPLLLESNSKAWRMDGQQGHVKIKLAKSIVPVSFSYEHLLRSNMLDENQYSCSPKVFRVFGFVDEQSEESIALGKFSFEINESVETEFRFENVKNKISVIQFNIENNHGSKFMLYVGDERRYPLSSCWLTFTTFIVLFIF